MTNDQIPMTNGRRFGHWDLVIIGVAMSIDFQSPERYSRQVRVPGIGKAGQERIGKSRVTVCGCGALGTVLANHLVRAGVGMVRIVDRDFVEVSNLQRQVLFDESDVTN